MSTIEDLLKELDARGTAEIANGTVIQITLAIDETEESVKFLQFDELKEQRIIPIAEACSKCTWWSGKFPDVASCQAVQKDDAQARGFHILICPDQLV